MQTLSICATKGGVGKTTLATCLAVTATADGLNVALIDLDPQQSMNIWWQDRGQPEQPALVTWSKDPDQTWDKQNGVAYLPTALRLLAEGGIDLVIIDTPPALMDFTDLAIQHADFVLIPSQASSADVISNQSALEMAQRHNKQFAFIINRAEARDPAVRETMKFFTRHGPVITPAIGNRRIYRAAFGEGKTGAEKDSSKARPEIKALWSAIKRKLRAAARQAA